MIDQLIDYDFLDQLRTLVKTFSQRSVEIFDRYLDDLNKQRDKDSNLTKAQVKALGE